MEGERILPWPGGDLNPSRCKQPRTTAKVPGSLGTTLCHGAEWDRRRLAGEGAAVTRKLAGKTAPAEGLGNPKRGGRGAGEHSLLVRMGKGRAHPQGNQTGKGGAEPELGPNA